MEESKYTRLTVPTLERPRQQQLDPYLSLTPTSFSNRLLTLTTRDTVSLILHAPETAPIETYVFRLPRRHAANSSRMYSPCPRFANQPLARIRFSRGQGSD